MEFASHQHASAAAGDSDINYAHDNEDTYAADDGAGSGRDGADAALVAGCLLYALSTVRHPKAMPPTASGSDSARLWYVASVH
jgi:hypothetical protein